MNNRRYLLKSVLLIFVQSPIRYSLLSIYCFFKNIRLNNEQLKMNNEWTAL